MSTTTKSVLEKKNNNMKMLTLKTNDNQEFQLEEPVATQSVTIKNMLEEDCTPAIIPLPNVSSETLIKVTGYLKAHADSSSNDNRKEELKEFDKKFIDDLDEDMVLDLVMAANYLDIKGLLDISCQKVADTVKDMSVENVRDFFGIDNDFTPEEEAKIRSENSWAFE